MGVKLTDCEKQKIVAAYIQTGSVNKAAQLNGVSWPAAKRAIDERGEELFVLLEQKKQENTASILAQMERKRPVVNEIIAKGLDVLNDSEKLANATPAQITTALGTLIDKFVPVDQKATEERPFELPARVIGRAFVDLNREIKPNISYILEGGRGSLKSSFWALKIVELLKNNPNIHACITRQVAGTLKDSVYAQMKWAINILGLDSEFTFKTSPLEIAYRKTGQTIYFRGLDDETKLKSIKPPFGYIGILWKEEKDQMKGAAQERSVNQSVLRGGDVSYDFSSYNPPKSKSSWVNKEKLIPNERRVIHHSTYLEAPPEWLGKKFIEDAEHLKEVNPAAYEHEYMGVPNGDGGNVFEYLEIRDIADEEIKRLDRLYLGCDWGYYPDPFAFVVCHYDPARERIYIIDEIVGNKLSNRQTADMIIEKGYGAYRITCDSAEPKSINDYRDYGLVAQGATKGPGSVEYSMKWLQTRTIVLDPKRTPHAFKEFTEYEFERDKDGEIISGYPDENNHCIDACRYALESVWKRRGSSA